MRELTSANHIRSGNGAEGISSAPFARSGIHEVLAHKLIDVVVEAVVYAMDVAQLTVPACPLPITYPPLGEGSHPEAIREKSVAEVEVLCLYALSPTLKKMPDIADKLTTEGLKHREK